MRRKRGSPPCRPRPTRSCSTRTSNRSSPGDYAVVEADGRITLLGRGSVSINSGGEKVYPEEVEGALKSHPDVFDAVVVGIPDPKWGEAVAAVIELRPPRRPSLDDVIAHARKHVAGYKAPRFVHVVDRLSLIH